MHRYGLYILVIAFALISCGSPEKSERKGDVAMVLGEYYSAGTYYKQAYQRTPNRERSERGRRAFKQAEAFRRYGYTARAVGAYRSAVRYGYTDTTTLRSLGDMLRMQADYKGAEKVYLQYLDSFPDDTMALMGLEGARMAPVLKQRGSAYTTKQAKMFNSNRADYCPSLLPEGDLIYFTSNRSAAVGDDLSNITGQKLSDIFFARKDEKGRWKQPEPVEGGLNTAIDEGAPSFSPDGKTMYLTICEEDATYPRLAQIATSTRSDANWSKAQPLKITGDTLSSYAHPAVSPDGHWLYFSSDLPGGYGGLDIWRCRIGDKDHNAVENLGPTINTAGNESFPAFRPSGELYFSSDGRGGMGGLDLFRATEDTLAKTWTVTHLPYPMNSQGDDFGITFEGLHNRGYFSSSRSTGGRGWDKIYEFSYPEKLLTAKGWVYEQDGYELPAATVYIVGSDGTNIKTGVKSDGSFEQALAPGVDYLFLATCKGYLNVPQQLHADSIEQEYQYTLQFPLPSISMPVLVRNVFYEFDRADITPESAESLDRLTKMLVENPNVTIELSAHCDFRGDSLYNRNLSQRRAESVVRYLTSQGIDSLRLTAVGYGEDMPKVVNKKLTETYPFLHEGDILTEAYIMAYDSVANRAVLDSTQREVCHALNRRTEFRVLRTTFGLFDTEGNLRPEAIKPPSIPKTTDDESLSEDNPETPTEETIVEDELEALPEESEEEISPAEDVIFEY